MNRLLFPAAAAALIASAPAALAQSVDHAPTAAWWQPTDVYGSLGYTGTNYGSGVGAHIGSITGRADARFGKYFGLEAEAAGGISGDHSAAGFNTRLDHQYAGYVVGYLPVLPNADLFARVGYGSSTIRYEGTGGFTQNTESVNYGAGGQYFFTRHDGLRAEYTRQDANGVGPNADTMSVSYVHKF